MLGSSELYEALNVTGVTTLLGTYGTKPAIWHDILIPQDYQGDSVNFYLTTPYNAASDEQIYEYTINCRSNTYLKARNIMYAVLTAINRVSYTDFYITCITLPGISPIDDTDNYNCPITATIKSRG